MKAIQEFVPEKMTEIKAAIMKTRDDWQDFLVKQGGAVKATGDGKVSGYLITFSDEKSPDLAGDYFTKDTDFGFHRTTPTLYHHGMDVKIGHDVIGEGTLTVDEVGVWIETQLFVRNVYEKAIQKLAQLGKLGWSSGTAPHLVKRERKGEANKITSWPLGLDASLTPTPAEPRSLAICMKSVEQTNIETMIESETEGDSVTQEQSHKRETKENQVMEEQKKEEEVKASVEEMVLARLQEEMRLAAEARAKQDEKERQMTAQIKSIVEENLKTPKAIGGAGELGGILNLKTQRGDDENKAFRFYLKTGDLGAYVKASAYQNETVEDEGGALVPHDFHGQIVMKRDVGSVVRAAGAKVLQTSLKIVDIPVQQTRFLAPTLTAESQTATATSYDQNQVATPFDLKSITVYKYTRLFRVSEELLADNKSNVETFLAEAIGNAFGLLENTIFLQGTGSTPQGAMYYSTAGKTSAVGGAISAADVMGTYYSMTQPYRDGASWVMRGSTEAAIRALQGNVWSFAQTPQGLAGANGLSTLVGNNKVYNSEDIVAIAISAKSVLFGNFAYYCIAERQGITIRRLNERFADTGQVGFICSERVGGDILQAEAFMHLVGNSA